MRRTVEEIQAQEKALRDQPHPPSHMGDELLERLDKLFPDVEHVVMPDGDDGVND